MFLRLYLSSNVASKAPYLAFDVEHFKYGLKTNSFSCPANQNLTTHANWYCKKNGKWVTQMKRFKTTACLSCELLAKCTKNARGRLIELSEHADLIFDNKIRIENRYDEKLPKKYGVTLLATSGQY